jgi:hypothetical protein
MNTMSLSHPRALVIDINLIKETNARDLDFKDTY